LFFLCLFHLLSRRPSQYSTSTIFSDGPDSTDPFSNHESYPQTPFSYLQPREAFPSPSRSTPPVMPRPSGRDRPGFGSALAANRAYELEQEWKQEVNAPLRKVIEYWRDACISCYFSAEHQRKFNHHRSEHCPRSDQLKGYNPEFQAFRKEFRLPHGCCFGCYLFSNAVVTDYCVLFFSRHLTRFYSPGLTTTVLHWAGVVLIVGSLTAYCMPTG
jgi:hypothetical protein